MEAHQLQDEAVELLAQLIRFDTVNPPGNERPAIEHLERYCAAAGLRTRVLADDPRRPNLVATLGDDDDDGETDPPIRPSACSGTSTPCSPTRRSGATTRGRGTSPTGSCGAAVRWT